MHSRPQLQLIAFPQLQLIAFPQLLFGLSSQIRPKRCTNSSILLTRATNGLIFVALKTPLLFSGLPANCATGDILHIELAPELIEKETAITTESQTTHQLQCLSTDLNLVS